MVQGEFYFPDIFWNELFPFALACDRIDVGFVLYLSVKLGSTLLVAADLAHHVEHGL